jgi:hypothetical protein
MMKMIFRQFALLGTIVAIINCASGHLNTMPHDDSNVAAALLPMIADEQRCAPCLLESESRAYEPWLSPTRGTSPLPPSEMAVAYANRNREGHLLSEALASNRYRLIRPDDVRRYFENGPREGWERLHSEFGERVGLLRMSLPAYSSSRDEALVTYSYDAGALGGETNYVLLTRRNGVWRVSETRRIIMS